MPPPVCPSNIIVGALTSPCNWKFVELESLSALPALPLTCPVTLPVKFPIKVVAYIPVYLFANDPIVLVFVTSGIIFLVSVSPSTFIVPPHSLLETERRIIFYNSHSCY